MNKFKVFGLAMALFWLTMVACTPAQEGNTNEESNLTKGEASVADTEVLPFFIGTYTNDTIKGIYYSILDLSSGQMKAPALAAESKNPSFLTLSSDQKHLYAVNELSPEESQVTSFSVDKKEGKLTEINSISAQGGAPCYVSISRDGSRGYVANYVGGNVISFGINTDGHLEGPAQSIKHEGSSITERQGNPHAHSIIPHPTLPYIYAADLGTDQVFIYKADGEGALTKNEPANYDLPGGAGPRHLDFHQSLNVAYIINELNSTITVVNINDNGGFDSLQTVSTLPEGFEGTSYPADIHIHPNGKYLYGSNRGHDSIVSYEVDQKTGQLSVIGFADQDIDWPRNFAITPAGDFLLVANQKGSSIVSYKIDVATGKLNHTGNVLSVGQPVCILYLE